MNLLKITHTYKPCGTKVHYPFGMQAPTIKDLTYEMKEAVLAAVQEKSKSVKPKLKVA